MSTDDDTPIYHQLAAEQLFDLDLAAPHGPTVVERAHVAPPDEHDAGAGAHLGTVTDSEWAAAHHTLIRDVPDLAPELDYIWDPARDGRDLIDAVERDMAHRPGRYDPNVDERFHGGGFRGQ